MADRKIAFVFRLAQRKDAPLEKKVNAGSSSLNKKGIQEPVDTAANRTTAAPPDGQPTSQMHA